MKIRLQILPNKFSICKLGYDYQFPKWAENDIFYNITRTTDELSVVTLENCVPMGVLQNSGWRMIKVLGPLDLSLTGITFALTKPLAEEKINIFAMSTYDTDYLLVKDDCLDRSRIALEKVGFEFVKII